MKPYCRKMIKNAGAINDPDVPGDVSPLAVQPIIMAFKGMDKVVKGCFSTGKFQNLSIMASNNLLETSDTLLHQLRYLQQKKGGQVFHKVGWSDHLSYRDLPGQDLH